MTLKRSGFSEKATPLVLFAREWLRSPARVGAIVPSSAKLADAMTEGLAGFDAPVLELGPGTGVFTAAVLRQGVAPSQFAMIESNETFAADLARRFPQSVVIHGDAGRVRHLSPFGPGGAGMILSGLPFLSMPATKVMQILAGCKAALQPAGELRLFTYGLKPPIPATMLVRLGATVRRRSFVTQNLPPASVYAVTFRAGSSGSHKSHTGD